jgi:hypothetical protein
MDSFVYESARDGMLLHVDSGYEDVDWNSKPFWFFILLLPKYLEDNHRALTASEMDAIVRTFTEYHLRRVLEMVQNGFVHQAICAELQNAARRVREMLMHTQ